MASVGPSAARNLEICISLLAPVGPRRLAASARRQVHLLLSRLAAGLDDRSLWDTIDDLTRTSKQMPGEASMSMQVARCSSVLFEFIGESG